MNDKTAVPMTDERALDIFARVAKSGIAMGLAAQAEAAHEYLATRLRSAAEPVADARDETMVELFPGLPKIPRWTLTYANELSAYMAANHPGFWAITGVQGRDHRPDEDVSAARAPPPRPDPPEVDEAMVERVAEVLYEDATDEPWTVAGVEHDIADRVYYRELARAALTAALKPAAGSGGSDAP